MFNSVRYEMRLANQQNPFPFKSAEAIVLFLQGFLHNGGSDNHTIALTGFNANGYISEQFVGSVGRYLSEHSEASAVDNQQEQLLECPCGDVFNKSEGVTASNGRTLVCSLACKTTVDLGLTFDDLPYENNETYYSDEVVTILHQPQQTQRGSQQTGIRSA